MLIFGKDHFIKFYNDVLMDKKWRQQDNNESHDIIFLCQLCAVFMSTSYKYYVNFSRFFMTIIGLLWE